MVFLKIRPHRSGKLVANSGKQMIVKLTPFWPLTPSIHMDFREDSENHGLEARNRCFGRVFQKSPKLAPFWLLMPSIGTSGCGDSEYDVLEAQILYFG
jgi:hypothetical protein